MSTVFLGEHPLRVGLLVDDTEQVHRAVSNIAKHRNARKARKIVDDGGEPLRVNLCTYDIDAVFHLAEGKYHFAILKQIVLKIGFLLTYPSKRQTCRNIDVGFGDALSPKLPRNRGKGEDVIILVVEFVGFEFLVPDTDGIILSVPYEQVGYKGGFGIAFHNSRGKAAVCRFHIAVAVVDTDEIGLVHFLHTFISPFYCLWFCFWISSCSSLSAGSTAFLK